MTQTQVNQITLTELAQALSTLAQQLAAQAQQTNIVDARPQKQKDEREEKAARALEVAKRYLEVLLRKNLGKKMDDLDPLEWSLRTRTVNKKGKLLLCADRKKNGTQGRFRCLLRDVSQERAKVIIRRWRALNINGSPEGAPSENRVS